MVINKSIPTYFSSVILVEYIVLSLMYNVRESHKFLNMKKHFKKWQQVRSTNKERTFSFP